MHWSKYLAKVSNVHAMDCSKNDKSSHIGSDGSKPLDRMKRYGYVFSNGAENIQSGKDKAFDIVMWMIVDDGVPSRSHRINIFKNSHRICGISTIEHNIFGTFTVIKYAFYY